MSTLEIVALVILAAGALGYVVSLIYLWRFRAWMGRRGSGWPRILLGTLLWLVGLLAALYLASLLLSLGVVPRRLRLPLNFGMGIALAVAPWGLAIALFRWWPAGVRVAWWGQRDGGDD